MARKTDYLFQRPGSANWWIKLQSPGKRIEKSLHTPDRKQAEIIALPLIAHHKAALLAAKPRMEAVWRYEYQPSADLQNGPNGERVAATETELKFYGPDGRLLRTASNGGPMFQLINLERLGIPVPVGERMFTIPQETRAKVTRSGNASGDDAILDTYLKHANITGYAEREARDVWALFKRLTDNKPLKNCDRDDGRQLVAYFDAKGNKSKTIIKKIAWLNAAVNLAISEERHKTINPFSSIVPKRKDSERRLPLSDADMKAIKRNLSSLDKSDQLLVRLLASTGMRLSEAFEIAGEDKERGVRYVVVGAKTEQSLRRVPLPAAMLSGLPQKITGPLFRRDAADPSDAASKRLNRFLRDCGIDDPRKVIHSFRHRAQDRLRAAECPEDIRWSILGHERETVAAGYGEGFAVSVLKKWIDKIGF
jgi:integrase